jgi:hypothetical protein
MIQPEEAAPRIRAGIWNHVCDRYLAAYHAKDPGMQNDPWSTTGSIPCDIR